MVNYHKIWIVGASGRLGSALRFLLDPLYSDILSTDSSDVDITNLEEAMLFGERNFPQVIINCAGLSSAEACESNPTDAWRVNALGARNLAIVANQINAALVHLSTDDVFSGDASTPYTEFCEPKPRTVYGRSKWAGEQYVRELCPKHFIIRSSWLYGKRKLRALIEKAKSGRIEVAEGQLGTPTSSLELAHFIIHLIGTHAYGTYHASCEGVATRQEFVREVLHNVGMHDVEIVPIPSEDSLTGLHPNYQVLENFVLHLGGVYSMPDWKTALHEFMKDRF